jgi:hypothetical protein
MARLIIRIRLLGPQNVHIQENMKEPVLKLSQLFDVNAAEQLVEVLSETLFATERNGNMKIQFFATSLRLHHIMMEVYQQKQQSTA